MSVDAGQTVVSSLVNGQNYVVAKWLCPSVHPIKQSVVMSVTDEAKIYTITYVHVSNDGT